MLITGEKEYYERQFATLRSFEEVDLLDGAASDVVDDLEEEMNNEFAMKVSNYANILLLVLKVSLHLPPFILSVAVLISR